MKYSKQRELIYNWVCNNAVHPTADEVYQNLKVNHKSLSLGTVYRNLNLLADTGRLMKINVPNASDRFDGTIQEHHHMICEKCGKVYDIHIPELADLSRRIEDTTDFSLNTINIVLHGTCKGCVVDLAKNS